MGASHVYSYQILHRNSLEISRCLLGSVQLSVVQNGIPWGTPTNRLNPETLNSPEVRNPNPN